MVVGVLKITLLFHGCHSLKDKRRILKSLLQKSKNKFNLSAAEVAAHDIHGRAVVAFSTVGTDLSFVNSVMDKVADFIDALEAGEIIDQDLELITL